MDGEQLGKLKAQHEALKGLNNLMDVSNLCAVNTARHCRTAVWFTNSGERTEINFIHQEEGGFVVETNRGAFTLSDKSKNALEAMSSTMATVVKSVLNEELEEMKKAFGEISIDGHHTTEIDEE